MLDTGVAGVTVFAMSNGHGCILNSCVHEVAQHVCPTEMLNTLFKLIEQGIKRRDSEITKK